MALPPLTPLTSPQSPGGPRDPADSCSSRLTAHSSLSISPSMSAILEGHGQRDCVRYWGSANWLHPTDSEREDKHHSEWLSLRPCHEILQNWKKKAYSKWKLYWTCFLLSSVIFIYHLFARIFLCSPSCPGTCNVDQADLELREIQFLLLPQCWD